MQTHRSKKIAGCRLGNSHLAANRAFGAPIRDGQKDAAILKHLSLRNRELPFEAAYVLKLRVVQMPLGFLAQPARSP